MPCLSLNTTQSFQTLNMCVRFLAILTYEDLGSDLKYCLYDFWLSLHEDLGSDLKYCLYDFLLSIHEDLGSDLKNNETTKQKYSSLSLVNFSLIHLFVAFPLAKICCFVFVLFSIFDTWIEFTESKQMNENSFLLIDIYFYHLTFFAPCFIILKIRPLDLNMGGGGKIFIYFLQPCYLLIFVASFLFLNN